MPKFKVLSQVDAYVNYITEVEAEDAEEAVDIAYEGNVELVWEEDGVMEFDARRVVALDDDGNEIEGYKRGEG